MHACLKALILFLVSFVVGNPVSAHQADIDLLQVETTQRQEGQVAPSEEEQGELFTLEKCEFFFVGDVSVERIAELLSKIKHCFQEDFKVTLFLSSTGGDPSAAAMFYDAIPIFGQRSNLTIVALGDVYSSAVIMFLAGDNRPIGRNANILIHQGDSYADGERFTDKDLYELMIVDQMGDDIYAKIISEGTGLSLIKTNELIDASTIFDATESLKNGFATEIVGEGNLESP